MEDWNMLKYNMYNIVVSYEHTVHRPQWGSIRTFWSIIYITFLWAMNTPYTALSEWALEHAEV